MPRKSLSGHGVLKWWRSLFIAEKSWLLRRRHGPHLHCRSCKAVEDLKFAHFVIEVELKSNAFSGACTGVFAFCKYHSQRLKAGQFVDQSGWSHQGQYLSIFKALR